MKLATYRERVRDLLKEATIYRNSDYKIIARIWYQDLKILNTSVYNLTGYGFLSIFSEGKLTNPESIRRVRQKLQEEFPELRGDNYNERHKESNNVLEELFETPEFKAGGTP